MKPKSVSIPNNLSEKCFIKTAFEFEPNYDFRMASQMNWGAVAMLEYC